MILCHGPTDALYQVRVDDKAAWTGASTGGQITIDAEGLFGGESREGGVSGLVDVEMGGNAQVANDYLSGLLSNVPGHRGVLGLVLRKCYLGMNPYLKRWAAVVKRIHVRQDGIVQWYDAKAEITSSNILPSATGSPRRLLVEFDTDASDASEYAHTPTLFGTVYSFSGGNFAIGPVVANTYVQYSSANLGAESALGASFFVICTLNSGVNDGANALIWVSGGFSIRVELVFQFPFTQWQFLIHSVDLSAAVLVGPLFDPGTMVELEVRMNAGWTSCSIYTDGVLGTTFAISTPPSTSGTIQSGKFVSGAAAQDMAISKLEMLAARSSPIEYYGDMNPAHIIRECLTDPDWGMGYQEADIDDTTFTSAADTLYDEEFGLSLIWDRQIPIEDFIREVLKHIEAVLYVSRVTGRFILKLIRADYDPSTLLIFDESNISKVENVTRRGFDELYNSVSLKYVDNGTNRDASVELQDIAQVQMQGVVINTTVNYPGIPNAILAGKVAARDLRSLSHPAVSCIVHTNRDAKDLTIGDVFKLSWLKFDFSELIMRISGISYGNGRNNTIRIEAVEDVFSTPSVSYVVVDPPGWIDPNVLPIPVTYQLAFEAPYYELAQALGQATADSVLVTNNEAGYLGVAAVRPASAINAILSVNSGAGYTSAGPFNFCPFGTILSNLDQSDTVVVLDNGVSLTSVIAGTHAQLNDEILVVVSIVGSTFTFERGALDTVPAEHSIGDQVFFWGTFFGADTEEYNTGETVNAKVLPITGLGQLSLVDAVAMPLTMAQRAFRPYPPANYQIDGLYFPSVVIDSFDITWVHRDRLQQTSGTLLSFLDGSVGPEAGISCWTVLQP
jgi:hypothetical protein